MIETERLILRRFRENDIDDFFEVTSNKKVCDMSGWIYVEDKLSAQVILKHQIENPHEFAIVWKENNKVIGTIELKEYNKNFYTNMEVIDGAMELSYLLSEDYWGKGIVPEAINAMMDYGFNTLQVPQILAGYFVNNPQSKRVQEKTGFKEVGQIDYEFILQNKTETFVQTSMTKEEYLERQKNMEK